MQVRNQLMEIMGESEPFSGEIEAEELGGPREFLMSFWMRLWKRV